MAHYTRTARSWSNNGHKDGAILVEILVSIYGLPGSFLSFAERIRTEMLMSRRASSMSPGNAGCVGLMQ
jgi:hypothetical protein